MPDFEFVLKDRNGKEHRYQGNLHPFESEAAKLALQLSTVCAEPLALLLPAVMDAPDGEIVASAKVPDLLSGASAIMTKIDLTHWFPEIFKYTSRDGVPLVSGESREQAFRGNLSEALRALIEVVDRNDFLPWLAMLAERLQSQKDTAKLRLS